MPSQKIGRYTILRTLDPEGETFLGEGPDGYRVVLRPLNAATGAERARIQEDARRVAALSHPNIPTAQVGLDGDQAFIATEHIVAASFADWLKGRPSPSERLRFVASFSEALCHAHEQGVVHGSLAPTTVEVSEDGECVLSGFSVGGAKPSAALAHYLAPEVLQGGKPSASSDVFSAAILICESLGGRHPFARGTAAAVKEAILTETPTPFGPEVPRDLADAIMACLEKDPDWRPKDLSYVAELSRKTAPAGAKPISKAVAPVKAAPRSAPASAPLPSFTPKASAPSNRLPLLLGVVVAVAASGAGAWYFLSPPGSPKPVVADQPTPAPTAVATTPSAVPSVPPSAIPSAAPKNATPSPAELATPQPSERPTELPTVRATPTPTPFAPPPTPVATPTAVAVVESRPTPAPLPPTPTPQAVPVEPVGPASLRNVTPTTVRHGTTMLDIHGSGLRSDHRAFLVKGKEIAKGINVVRQRLVNPGLLQVVLQIDPSAPTGAYLLALADPQGESTNSVKLELSK